jgi:hypothetical protein
MSWYIVKSWNEINKGDLIIGTNYTHSAKYLDLEGYEEYNRSCKGVVISDNHKSWFDIVILNEDNEEEFVVYDCGSSGEFYIQKFISSSL